MRIAYPFPCPRATRCVLGLFLSLTILAGSGCTYYHSLGKGQHLAPRRARPHHDPIRGGEEVVLEVTTDADGAVSNIRFLKPSRSDAANNFLDQSIRSGWPPMPSTRTVTRITHVAGGFSEPEIVSTTPLQ